MSYADELSKLPTDDSEITSKEKYYVNMMFPKEEVAPPSPVYQIIAITTLFSILSLPVVDQTIEKYVKISHPYGKLLVKSVLFMVIYFMLLVYVIQAK
jgi:hypothetical protein